MLDEKRRGEIVELTQSIQGWAHLESLVSLYDIAQRAPQGTVIVELGSWKGLSSGWIGTALKDRGYGRLYCVDTWAGTPSEQLHKDLLKDYAADQLYNEFLGNVRRLGLEEVIVPVRMDTRQAAREWKLGTSISMLYVDAGHDYAEVRADFEHWSPNVIDGGVIVFDDVPSFAGPTRLVTELPTWYRWAKATPNQWAVVKLPA